MIALRLAVKSGHLPQTRPQPELATRAMLGEERWIADRPRDAAAVSTVTSVAAVTLVYWQQMVRYRDRDR